MAGFPAVHGSYHLTRSNLIQPPDSIKRMLFPMIECAKNMVANDERLKGT